MIRRQRPESAERALRLGAVAGALAAVVAGAAYLVPPLLGLETSSAGEASIEVLYAFFGHSVAFHAAVGVLPTTVATLGALVVARRRGLAGSQDDAALLAGVVLAAVAAVWLVVLGALVAMGATDGVLVVYGFFVALVVGLAVTGVVVLAASAGALAGYVAFRGARSVFPGTGPLAGSDEQ